MSLSAIVRALRDAGATADMIVAAVEAHEAEADAKVTERRAKDAARKAAQRVRDGHGMSRGVTRSHAESRGQDDPGPEGAARVTPTRTHEGAQVVTPFSSSLRSEEVGGGGGGERERAVSVSDDWPAGKAQDHARLIVSEVASPRLDPMKSPGLVTTAGRLLAWRREGASWEHDVIPVVASVCAKQRGPVSTWKFFDQAIARSIADNRDALQIPSAGEGRRATGPPMSLTDRIAAEHAESRRMALEMLAAENGPTN